jgi:multidrug efflux system membrane fusion protein
MRYLTLSIVAVMPALLCAACVKKPEQAPAVVPPTVTVQTPQVREVTTYEEFVGRCEAVQSVELRARVTGILETQEFEDSQIVNEGDLLFTIEDAPYRAAVASAQAALAAREADLHLAQINLDKAQQAYEREAVTEIEMAKVTADRDAAQAAVQGAQAALDTAKIDLGYTKIYAPMTGRISRALIDVGNLIGGLPPTPLTSIVQDDPVHVFFDVDERSVLKRLEERPRETRDGRERLPAFLQLLDGTRYGESGVIDYAANRIDANTGTLTVRASIPNPNGRLYAGMFVRVLLPDEHVQPFLHSPGARSSPRCSVSIVIVIARRGSAGGPAGGALPGGDAADHAGQRVVPGRQRPDHRRDRGHADRAGGQRRRGHDLHVEHEFAADGTMNAHGHVRDGTDLDMANVLVQNRVAMAEPRLPEEVRRQGVTVKKQSTGHRAASSPDSARRPAATTPVFLTTT